ncbi:dolichol-phosphate mannosyltransferase [Granulicella rosea]|uniref:Dolichol-phosphate mannosyltransferase n=1 Tax=Granulicella rosea TaxID=474952 RepID=A0A239IUB0_9BACT|nr:glycosyltransferase family 2 protein [Granulicella rosea]SNS96818.1 dolichol-phosphate mannosyltransferase [Granulicella rosea]
MSFEASNAEIAYCPRIDLAVVIPTYNERGNIPELVARIEEALTGLDWELIFVDDDSPDETAEVIREYACRDCRIRLIHRIGRRGLSSACIEGILATTSNYVAIMDADMQHDETILPRMLETLRQDSLDLVIGTRNAEGGSMGQFGQARVMLSRMGQKISNTVCQCRISDPMSGFFLFNRSFFNEVVRQLHGGGFKILVDMLASSERPVRFAEVGYTFRSRKHGTSKLDVNTGVEYLFLIIDKLTGFLIPIRFAAFSLVGAAGAATHLALVALLMFHFQWHFMSAQVAATFVAMTENFFLNNLITWRDRSLRGLRMVTGLFSFWVACSFGAWANVVVARSLVQSGARWYMAGIAGIILGSVWNYSIANLFTWQMPKRARPAPPLEIPAYDSELVP